MGLYANLYSICRRIGPDFSYIMGILRQTDTGHSTYQKESRKELIEFMSRREDLYQILLKTYFQDYQQTLLFPMLPSFRCWKQQYS